MDSIDRKYLEDKTYRPYCVSCTTMERMEHTATGWKCKCGAIHTRSQPLKGVDGNKLYDLIRGKLPRNDATPGFDMDIYAGNIRDSILSTFTPGLVELDEGEVEKVLIKGGYWGLQFPNDLAKTICSKFGTRKIVLPEKKVEVTKDAQGKKYKDDTLNDFWIGFRKGKLRGYNQAIDDCQQAIDETRE